MSEEEDKIRTTIILTSRERDYLTRFGGNTKGIKKLIQEKLEDTNTKQEKDTITTFYNTILLPSDPHLRDSYTALIEYWTRTNMKLLSPRHAILKIANATGYNLDTVYKHVKRLESQGYITDDLENGDIWIVPSIRVHRNRQDEFRDIFIQFSDFLKSGGDYVDMTNTLIDLSYSL